MTLEKLQVIIQAQIKEYMDALKKVQKQTEDTTKKVERYTAKIRGAFSKIGKVIGAALSVAAITKFGKDCIELGSDLAEVQNVVDVAFGKMGNAVNDFAKNAISQYGLSELSAKKYASNMGSMLKSMGFSDAMGQITQQGMDMSLMLTGLAGDMASFYNLSGDEAFAKIRAGISGETEPLKQLGINLSVANLQEFAMSQGIKKTYNAMTQQEQALIRYNYLLSVTSDAQGDFARTSDSWANQTKILAERFNSLKAAIGQGLINVFLPVIRVLNQVIAKLSEAANAFKRFTEIITGRKSSASTSMTGISASADLAAGSVEGITDATQAAGGAAKKAKEEYQGLAGFDEINALTKASDASGGGESAGDTSGLEDMSGFVEETTEETDQGLNPVLQKLIDRLKELRDLFKDGFKAGLGNVTLEPLRNALESIKQSLRNIFTDSGVIEAANNWVNTMTYVIGQVAGSIASIVTTIATNLIGGIARYLEGNRERIRNYIVAMFDISGETASIVGNFTQAVANIFSAFGGENGQRVTANLIGIFADAFMGISELIAKAVRDINDVFTRPFIDNQVKIKEALDGTLGVIADVLGTIKQVVDDTADKINQVYDEHLAPLFNSLANGLSSIVSTIMNVYQTYILPVLQNISAKIDEFASRHLQPMIDKALELIGKVADAVQVIWNNVLVPFINWFIQNIVPVISEQLQIAASVFLVVAGTVADVVGDIFDVLGGLIDFITGVFSGDWELAWNGIKDIFGGIWQAILDIISGIFDGICTIIFGSVEQAKKEIDVTLAIIKSIFEVVWNSIKNTVQTVWNNIKTIINTTITVISTTINTVLNRIKTIFSTILTSIKTTVNTIFTEIRTTISTIITAIQTSIATVLSNISNNWSLMWNGMKTAVVNIFNGIWGAIKGVVNSIIGGIEKMANSVINGINAMIDALNKLQFDVPDWVPEIGGKKFGFDIPNISSISIPKLEMGGIVNSPTLAMIGEHGKEAVVPLQNNTGWMDRIAERFGEIVSVNMAQLEQKDDGEQTVVTVVKLDGRTLLKQTDKYRKRQGFEYQPV